MSDKHSHYFRMTPPWLKKLDIYRLLDLFNVHCPVAQHVVKKALVVGQRGHKDTRRDWEDIRDSAIRALEMMDEREAGSGEVNCFAAPEQDMSDWRDWRVGDLVVVSDENDENLPIGAVVSVATVESSDYEGVCVVQVERDGVLCWTSAIDGVLPMRWHSRPSAQPVIADDDAER